MDEKAKLVLVEYDIETDCLEKFKNLYSRADIVYGLRPTKYSKSKFTHLFNKRFYLKAADSYADYINKELKNVYRRTNMKETTMLDYFELLAGKSLFFLFLAREIKELYPGYKIVILTSSKMLKILKSKHNFLQLDKIKVIYQPEFRFNLRYLKSVLIPQSKIGFVFINALSSFIFLLKLLMFKLKTKPNSPFSVDILYLSASFRCWTRQENNRLFDFCYANSFYRIASESSLKVWCLTRDITSSANIVDYCMFKYLNIYDLFKAFCGSLRVFLSLLGHFKRAWMLTERGFLQKIVFARSLEVILNAFKPKAVVYYDEALSFGRMIGLAANKSGIDSYGFQHGIDTRFHVTYKSLKLYRYMPVIFPKYFFVYGPYSKSLFSDYGYPESRMIEIGFDRIKLTDTCNAHKEAKEGKKDKLKTLFIGQDPWFNELFEELYRKRDEFPISRLFFRPHPLFPSDEEEFSANYPDAVLINSGTSELNENIKEVDCVIGYYSTSLINAIYQRKTTISWQPYGLEDLCELRYWGAQVVESLETIDWNEKGNPDNVVREVEPKADLVKFLKQKYEG